MSTRVLVLYGGKSTERDISIKSGRAVSNALKKKGYEVIEYDFQNHIEDVVKDANPDVVFIALHGKFGEDGTVQGALELMNIPYTGSSVFASALCMNKLFSKFMFREIDIKTPSFAYFRRDNTLPYSYVSELLGNDTLVIKPVDQGSTIGITIAKNEDSYNEGLAKAFELSDLVIVEDYIKGTEITVAIIGNYPDIHVLPIIEIVPAHEFYDFESKYTPSMSKHIIPARISSYQKALAEEYAKRIYKEFGLRDFARIDMIANSYDVYVLEVNTIPGFTETSLVPDAAKAENISFEDLVDFIVQEALQRKR
ncbi:MAG: D-alanine--D-alanine ligase family protein [Caldisericum sp.]